MDDPFVSCPYDPAHRVPRSRIQGHIVKCQVKHPELAICPYNATHRLPHSEMTHHVKNCPSRAAMFPETPPTKIVAKLTSPTPILQREYLPETDPNHEIWDD
ncbi:gametocyte-specific factor 1-like [Melitaea cinxia]|uniref:gametocyte-specific factor 1-like n=1 Tax=Melitaea cinxia TaxID=113334 RepID=UPI001E26EFE0|nr:gametocyte-specific factor 1-like [Melitaea cinxia]